MRKASYSSVRVFYPKWNRRTILGALKRKLGDLQEKLPLLLVVVVGSYARGDYTVASDIDLLIVYKGPERKDAFSLVKKVLDLPGLEPHLYTQEVFECQQRMIGKMVTDGIAIFSSPEAERLLGVLIRE